MNAPHWESLGVESKVVVKTDGSAADLRQVLIWRVLWWSKEAWAQKRAFFILAIVCKEMDEGAKKRVGLSAGRCHLSTCCLTASVR